MARSPHARRSRRIRVLAAVGGFGLLGLSLFGAGIAAQAAPPDPAPVPTIISPTNGAFLSDVSPTVDVLTAEPDLRVDVFVDGDPYCVIPTTGPFGFSSCSGLGLPYGSHTFTAVADYNAPDPSIPSGPSAGVTVTIYDATPATIVPPASPTIDRTPSFEGTGPLGGVITEVYVMPGGPTLCAGVPVDGAGDWSCTSGVALPNAPYTLRMTWQDQGGTGSFTTTNLTVVSPTPPAVDDTFGPGWRDGYSRPAVQGDKDIGATEILVEVSSDGGGSWAEYCVLDGSTTPALVPDSTVWYCNDPLGAPLQLGDNLLRATEYNDSGEASAPGPPITITLVETPVVTFPADGAVTNDRTPQFEVENADGTTGAIYFASMGTQCSVPIVANGYSCSPLADLADGTYTYFAWVQPGQGLFSETRSITIDTTPPSVPVITGPAPPTTNDLRPTISGTGDPGTFVSVLVDGDPNACILTGNAPVDGSGNWECELVDPLTIDQHDVQAVGVDEAGNASAQSPVTVLDVVAPTATITPVFSPWYTSADFVQVQGTHSENTMTVQVDRASNPGGPWTPYCYIDYDVPVEGLTVWFCDETDTPQGTLSPGPNYLRATVTAAGGAVSPPSTPILITRVDPPTIGSPGDGAVIGDSTPTFSGTAPTQASFVEVVEAGEVSFPCTNVPVQADGSWSCTAGAMADGTYEVYVSTNIGPGNGPYTFTIDTTPPPFPVIDTPASPAVTADPTPIIGGSAQPNTEVTVWADGVPVSCGTGSFQPAADGRWACRLLGLDSSTHLIAASATNQLGVGSGTSPTQLVLTIDTTPPPPPFPVIDTPASPAVTADPTPIIGGSAQPSTEVTVWADGAPVSCGTGSFQPGADGRWGCRLLGLDPGTHLIAASATNPLGVGSGPSPTQLVLTIDPLAPPTALLTLAWSLGLPGGQFHPGDTVELTGSGLPVGANADAEIHSTPQWVGSAVTDASGTFTIDAVIPEDIEPGLHTFVVTVTAEGAEPSTLEQPIMIVARDLPPKASGGIIPESAETGSGGTGDGFLGDRNDPATPAAMTTALDTIMQIISNPVFIVTAGAAGLALLLFVAIPAELLNATLSEHYDRITKRIPRTNAGWWTRTKALLASTPVLGGILITVLASIVFGFADPGFGFDLVSLRVVLACAIGLFFVGFVANALTGAIVGRRWRLDTVMELKPFGLLLAIVGVVVSRLLDFSPGLLIGLLIGISLVGRVTGWDESRTAMVKTGVVWGLSILAWIGYSLLVEPLAGTSFAGNLTVETMVAITTEGLTALLIGLLPFKFLEGSAIWAHNKLLWGAAWLGAAASWVLIVLPQNYGEIRGSIWIWGAIVAGFAVVALTIYLVFRFAVKPEAEGDESENDTQDARIGSGR